MVQKTSEPDSKQSSSPLREHGSVCSRVFPHSSCSSDFVPTWTADTRGQRQRETQAETKQRL